MKDGDDSSADTHRQRNGKNSTVTTKFVSFLLVRATVSTSKKGTETMRAKFIELLTTLKEADDTCSLSIYQLDPIPTDEGTYSSIASKLITQPDKMPDSITAMSKYFFGARPYSNGGTIWSQIRLVHDTTIDNILADTKYDLQEKQIFLTKQTIQHWDVASIGFLKNLHPEVDTVSLSNFFQEQLPNSATARNISFGLKVKTPYDGQKREKNVVPGSIKFKERLQAVHVEVQGSNREMATKCLKNILASKAFRQRYTTEVRLIPLYDRRSSPYMQEKIKRCIVQHGQFCKCVEIQQCMGIEHIDTNNRKLKRTLRDLIVNMKDSHFLNIDLNWRGDCYQIMYPLKYEKEAKDKIAHLGAYLHRNYGADVLLSLPVETQEEIHDTTWDEDNDRPVSKLEKELDDVLAAGEGVEFVDLTLLKESAAPATNVTTPISSRFVPVLDTDSISTFGTTPGVNKSSATGSSSFSNSIALAGDSQTTVSDVTIESKISKLEDGYQEIKAMLSVITNEVQSRKPSQLSTTQPSSSAGSPTGDPAAGE